METFLEPFLGNNFKLIGKFQKNIHTLYLDSFIGNVLFHLVYNILSLSLTLSSPSVLPFSLSPIWG